MQPVWEGLLFAIAVLAVGAGARAMIERLRPRVSWRLRRLRTENRNERNGLGPGRSSFSATRRMSRRLGATRWWTPRSLEIALRRLRPTPYRSYDSQERRRLLFGVTILLAMLGAGAAVAVVVAGGYFDRRLPAPRATRPRGNSAQPRSSAPKAARAAAPKIPPYWIVRPDDTLRDIAHKNRLTVAQLEAYNPQIDPKNLNPGQRLNLWRDPPPPPAPRPKPVGPMFWTVRPGQSFSSIAAKTGINLDTLEQLNPRLKPASLHPGDRIRLRPHSAATPAR